MESNLKARAFAAYWGCPYRFINFPQHTYTVGDNYFIHAFPDLDIQLILTPLSEITDEDAIEVAKMCIIVDYTGLKLEVKRNGSEIQVKNIIGNTMVIRDNKFELAKYDHRGFDSKIDAHRVLKVIDYLRSKSYLLPFQGFDLLKENIATLKTEK